MDGRGRLAGRRTGGPMYQQVRQDLLARIRRGEFPPGSLLPSENQLCEEYGVSVTTARRAFLELVNEGVVQRKAGVGTMVAPRVRRARVAFVSIDYVGDAWRQISSVMGELIAGVGEYAWQHDAILSMTGIEDDESPAYLRSLVEDRSADGVLLRVANDIREEHLDILERAGMPYVVIKRHIPGRKMNYVNSDDVTGARLATSHLLELGYRRIGFVCAKPEIMVGRDRLRGYREALREYGVGYDDGLVRHEPYFTREMGYRAVRSLLELEEPPEAVFVASDTMAIGGYEAARDLGMEIPEDVAFVGYDDIPPAALLQPGLTTVRTSYYDFGYLATELLLDLIDGRELPPQRRVIRPRLVVRGSTVGTKRVGGKAHRDVGTRDGEGWTSSKGDPLAGKTVAGFGPLERLGREVVGACVLRGAREEGGADVHRGPGRDSDIVVYAFDAGSGMGRALGDALDFGRSLVRKGGGAECLLFAAGLDRENSSSEKVERAAVRAGMEKIVAELSLEARGRVNAVLCSPSDGARAGDVVAFLCSDGGACVNGEVLEVGVGRGRENEG